MDLILYNRKCLDYRHIIRNIL